MFRITTYGKNKRISCSKILLKYESDQRQKILRNNISLIKYGDGEYAQLCLEDIHPSHAYCGVISLGFMCV
jgi:hypothetical protein